MQEFILTIKVVVNTIEDVSEKDVIEEINDVLSEFDGGTAEVITE